MQKQSVWLGPLRGPVHKIMLLSVALAIASCGWLIFASYFLGSDVGMNQMLRPEDNVSARIALWALFAALLSASVYLSDTVGQIEPEPRGFFDIISLICGRLAMIVSTGIPCARAMLCSTITPVSWVAISPVIRLR